MAPTERAGKENLKRVANVLGSDMAGPLQQEIINFCFTAMEKGGGDNDIAKR